MKNLAKFLMVGSLILTQNSPASQYETDDVSEIVYDLPADEQSKLSQDLELEQTVFEDSIPSSANFRAAHNFMQHTSVIKGADHKKTKKAAKAFDVQKKNQKFSLPNDHWSAEIFETKNSEPVYLNDFLERLQKWALGAVVTEQDQALNFGSTNNNKLELITGYEPYHTKLFADIENAKDTIHMQMFGWHADTYGYDMANRLIKKAKEGVKVRVLMDKFGAQITGIFALTKTPPMIALIKHMRDNGVEVIIPKHRGLNYLDHRKLYVFDGKLAWSTGYTMDNLMRNDIMDQGTRIQGDLTYQYQSYFLVNWLYAGGTFPEAKVSMASFWSKYYAPLEETGTAEVKIITNISRVKREVTEHYLTAISTATKRVIVANRNFADPRFGKALLQAKKNGADVTVVLEEGTTGTANLYQHYAEKWLNKFQKAGIKALYFRDKDGKALIHEKVVLTDDTVSLGTSNFDLWSLYHNGEQNIVTKDPEFVEAVHNHLQNEVIAHSNVFKPKKGLFNKIKLSLQAILFKTYEIIF